MLAVEEHHYWLNYGDVVLESNSSRTQVHIFQDLDAYLNLEDSDWDLDSGVGT